MAAYIGTPTSRIDGHAKVTGAAKYAAEFNAPGLAHASLVTSTITKGRIAKIDASEAMRVAGVIDVITHKNRPTMASRDKAYKDDVAAEGSPYRPLYDDEIKFNGQPVAVVVAADADIARFAASLVRVEYIEDPFVTDLLEQRDTAHEVERPSRPRGDAEAAFAAAEVRHEADYFIPTEYHNPMELFATTVTWEGDGKLTVYDKTQGVQNVQRYLVSVFGMKPDDLKVVSPYVGGAFGSGLRPQFQVALAVIAARALERSVRLVLTRPQMYGLSYRPATIEHLALGAKALGPLEAVMHEAIAQTSEYEDFNRNDVAWADQLYKCGNTRYSHKLAKLDVSTPSDMRAPGAASGVYALECAMDELAVALKMDPLQLRFVTYSDREQNADRPYSSKKLRECYRQGAAAFGWEKRNPEPRSMRDGSELVGWGMATGVWEALQMPLTVRIVMTANGHAEVSSATSDIGTGTYTIMAQVAADMLGLPIDNVSIKLGDSTLSESPVEGGSWLAASVANSIATTAEAIRKTLLGVTKTMPDSPLADAKPKDVMLADGKIVSKKDASRAIPIADVMRAGKLDRIDQKAAAPVKDDGKYARNTHSAVFVEVRVDEQIGVIRVTRVVSAAAAGRILNTKTAHSQLLGGVVWGIGMALHEETLTDHRFGRIMNANLGEYHMPVNADIYDINCFFVDEPDATINPMGIKGVGEIGIVGVAAAIANAVYHATGKRVRDLPITIDKLRRD
ncbi:MULTISPECIES: xanthine dehydrogenase family protein molybdopterin-binding subunit [Rhodomicrobium]|uniref:xanthine dehydrogenase family protein molybdopterin-binding subunit n=1 Tax=Rhodomicrobium TaxID=1068 RepID=UPI000B4BF2EB|nr:MULTISPECIES: xanthine dehydrogenase family protein molybdopterin-binding subunit [Rhodomicrobium]